MIETGPYEVVNGVLYGRSKTVCELVRQRIPNAFDGFSKDAVGLGVVKGERLLGGVVFDQYTERNILMSGAFDSPRWCSRRTLRQLFRYPFVQLGLRRMTTITTADNQAAIRLDEALGFRLEGILRQAFPGDIDGLVYGMLREECRWLED